MSMTAINVLTAISLIWMLILIGVTAGRIIYMAAKRKTAKLYTFLKGFRTGSCFLVYFAAIPLFFCALQFNGNTVVYSVFSAIERSVTLIILSFNYDLAAPLMAANGFYAAVMYICYVAVILNAILFAVSLACIRLIKIVYNHKALHQKNNIYVVVGNNGDNKKIISSIARKGGYSVLLVSERDARDKEALNLFMIENKMVYMEYKTAEFCILLEKFIGRRRLWENRAVNIIINSADENENLLLTQELSKFINSHGDIKHNIFNRDGVNGYVFCEPKDTSTYNYYVENTHGAIQYINTYRLVAMDFISKYPLTKFMTDQIDEKFPALKKDAEVNFVMLGFGRFNRQLFHTSVSTQQFISVDGGKITEKPVHYCLYDKVESNADLILNHNFYRYENFLKVNKDRTDEFLPLPELPADVQFHKMSIRDHGFYQSLRGDLGGENKFSYIVIAYGTDLQNLDFGQKIAAKIKEWNLQGKVKLFVKIRDSKLVKDCADDIIFFGDEGEVVYNIDAILHEKIESLAKTRSFLYAQESQNHKANADPKHLGKLNAANKDEERAALERSASNSWYKNNSQCQRESNIYACLAIRSKLHLSGFDLQEKGGDPEKARRAAEKFMKVYQSGMPDNDPVIRDKANERDIDYSDVNFDLASVRKFYAVLEHQRWNANYISWGFVPATKREIAESPANGKDFTIRRHGCLTTFDGLKGYREIVADKDTTPNKSYKDKLKDADVIPYDYQIMDDVLWLLDNSGYELVEK